MENIPNNKLIIDKHKVTLNSTKEFRCLEITFAGSIKIVSLLPDNYIINKGLNKIIIVNLNNIGRTTYNKLIEIDLFRYKGRSPITRIVFIDEYNIKSPLVIFREELELWNTLRNTNQDDFDKWAFLTRNWEDMDFDGDNNKQYYIYRKKIYDKDTKTFTTTKEIRKR